MGTKTIYVANFAVYDSNDCGDDKFETLSDAAAPQLEMLFSSFGQLERDLIKRTAYSYAQDLLDDLIPPIEGMLWDETAWSSPSKAGAVPHLTITAKDASDEVYFAIVIQARELH